jgi:transposase-like protein
MASNRPNRKNPTRASFSGSRYSLMEFMDEFPDDDACLTYLWRARYSPDGEHAVCPRCQIERTFHRYHTAQQRQSWTCSACGLHVHPTAGTIFHKSSTSLKLWFYALYLITSTRCGISAKQLKRELGVTYKTAWRMFNVIRNSLMSEDGITLSGEVEIDETYFVHRRHANEPARRPGQSLGERVVVGAVERQGGVVARYVESATSAEVDEIVRGHILPSSMVYTDQSPIYNYLDRKGSRHYHRRVNHSARIYVDGEIHTQSVDGFWSLLKSGIRGTYHSVSTKWLQSYLNEYAWRYNQREHTRRQPGVKRMPVGEAKFRLLVERACQPTG